MADSDLIGCWDAIQAVKRDGETDKKAFSRIIRRCMTGELRCVAKTWSHEGEGIEYNVEVPAKTWNWNPLTTAGLDIHTGDWTLVSSHLKRTPNSGAGVWATLTGIGIACQPSPNDPRKRISFALPAKPLDCIRVVGNDCESLSGHNWLLEHRWNNDKRTCSYPAHFPALA